MHPTFLRQSPSLSVKRLTRKERVVLKNTIQASGRANVRAREFIRGVERQ